MESSANSTSVVPIANQHQEHGRQRAASRNAGENVTAVVVIDDREGLTGDAHQRVVLDRWVLETGAGIGLIAPGELAVIVEG
jgi:hypothetical protein